MLSSSGYDSNFSILNKHLFFFCLNTSQQIHNDILFVFTPDCKYDFCIFCNCSWVIISPLLKYELCTFSLTKISLIQTDHNVVIFPSMQYISHVIITVSILMIFIIILFFKIVSYQEY